LAIIPQTTLFSWEDVDQLGDLSRFKLVLDRLPDEELMQALESERGCGRNDYPVRVMWNLLIAGIVYQHPSIESLIRELKRNAQLRQVCGMDLFTTKFPESWNFSRFNQLLIKHQGLLNRLFQKLVEQLVDNLDDFGSVLALDGKAVPSRGKPSRRKTKDGRRDCDADWGVKHYKGTHQDGTHWVKKITWFGYNLHLIVDANYELPVAYHLTKASNSEVKEAHKLLDSMKNLMPGILDEADYLLADRGYDDSKLIKKLWDDYQIKPVIDIRNLWKDGEDIRILDDYENVGHDFKGTVYCYDPDSESIFEMPYAGFEKARETLKYRCPALHYGIECKGQKTCPIGSAIRIKMETNRRVFTPIARSSYKWKDLYKKRSSVERVNSRLDESFGFEKHTIRGEGKMTLRVSLALIVMNGMALGRLKQNQAGKLRSLIAPAA
jgi:hypothetical protein